MSIENNLLRIYNFLRIGGVKEFNEKIGVYRNWDNGVIASFWKNLGFKCKLENGHLFSIKLNVVRSCVVEYASILCF